MSDLTPPGADRDTIGVTGIAILESTMIRSSPRLAELEARYQREAYAGLSYEQALRRFAALWAEAVLVNPDIGADWEEDLAADLAIARAVNGLPPNT